MLDRQLEIVREDLHRRHEGGHPPAEIDRVLDEVIAEARATARVATFLPVFVERDAAARLAALATARSQQPKARPEVLYACMRNAGRSQLAAAITRHLAGEAVFVRAVGLAPAAGVQPEVLAVLDERGISHAGLYREEIVARTVHRADVVVLLGVDEIPDVPGDRYTRWAIADPEGRDLAAVRAIADEIEARVRVLLDELGVAARTPAGA